VNTGGAKFMPFLHAGPGTKLISAPALSLSCPDANDWALLLDMP